MVLLTSQIDAARIQHDATVKALQTELGSRNAKMAALSAEVDRAQREKRYADETLAKVAYSSCSKYNMWMRHPYLHR
jgi:hypothetical protein